MKAILNRGRYAKSFGVTLIIALMLGACANDAGQGTVSEEGTAYKAGVDGNGWTLVSPKESGVSFSNIVPEDYSHYFIVFNYVYNGGGVASGDLNNDGLPDLYFTGNRVQDQVYKNNGNMNFTDVSNSANLILDNGWNAGVTMADVNADGLLDIYVCRGAWEEDEVKGNLLYINKGDFKFKESAKEFGLDDEGFSVHANFFDYDSDGDLDAYVINRPNVWALTHDQILKGREDAPDGVSDKLYRNDGGKFSDVSEESGIGRNFAFGLSVTTLDVNNDNHLDIYIANDFIESDFLYVNQGDGTFKQEIDKHTNHNSLFSMGTDVQDINNDGLEDIYTVEMLPEDYYRSKVTMFEMLDAERFDWVFNQGHFHHQYMHNTLGLNQGNGFYSDIANYSGVKSTDWSWSCLLSDYDNDGLRDIFVANGFKRDVFDRDMVPILRDSVVKLTNTMNNRDSMPPLKDLLDMVPSVKLQNRIFKNSGNLKFEDANKMWSMEGKSFSNGATVADFDLDGDLDLVVNNMDDPAFVYRNDFAKGNSLRVKLKGPKGNPNGLGALVELKTDNGILVERSKMVRGYQSSVEPILHFGLGDVDKVNEIKVSWLGNKVTVIKDVKANQVIEIDYANAKSEKWKRHLKKETFFVDITAETLEGEWKHEENYFKDYGRQVLLPHSQSMHGPALAVGDINGDGLDDMYIGGAYEQAGQLYLQNSFGKFVPKSSNLLSADKDLEDVGATFVDADGDGDLDLYVVSGGTEYSIDSEGYQDRLYLNKGDGTFSGKFPLPKMNISGSVAVASDIDNDKKAEIFVGGRVLPYLYPEPVSSMALKNFGQSMQTMNGASFIGLDTIGMVTDAKWVQLDDDALPELVIVGEWMPVTIFKYVDGKFRNVTKNYGLDKTNGWWFSVENCDIDGDGDQDLVLGNLGLNYKFHASEEEPFQAFADDFDKNGTYDVFLAKYLEDKRLVPIRGRDCTSEQIPQIAENFPTFRDFAKEDIYGIVGSDMKGARHVIAYEFASIILENKGGSFVRHELPKEAQFSTVRGIVCHDFDQDGIQDIVLGGNMFPSEAETTRADASQGLFLKGKGKFEFDVIGAPESGIEIPFDVRHVKKVKLANEAQPGLVIAINDGVPVIYKWAK